MILRVVATSSHPFLSPDKQVSLKEIKIVNKNAFITGCRLLADNGGDGGDKFKLHLSSTNPFPNTF